MLRRIFSGKLTSIALTNDPTSVQLTLLHKTTSVDDKGNQLFLPIICFVEPSCAEELKIGDMIETIIASDARKIDSLSSSDSLEGKVTTSKIPVEFTIDETSEDETGALRNRSVFSKVRDFVKH